MAEPKEVIFTDYQAGETYQVYTYMYCVALPCLFVCLTLLASFFLPSHLSFKSMYMYIHAGDCLGCAVLLCLVCLFDLACLFLSSFSSLI